MAKINKTKIEDLGLRDVPKIAWHYVCRNVISLSLLCACVVLGMTKVFGWSKLSSWKNWEVCALGFTFIYTCFIYREGYKKKYFNDIGGEKTALIVVSIFALLGVFLVSLNEYFRIFIFLTDRRSSMVCLFLTALLFVILDFTLAKALVHQQPPISKAFFLSMKFSDIPISIAFAILTLYAFTLGENKIDQEHMDAFFGGTIAFQMMLSNIIWTLTDDVFVEHAHQHQPKAHT